MINRLTKAAQGSESQVPVQHCGEVQAEDAAATATVKSRENERMHASAQLAFSFLHSRLINASAHI